MLLHVAHYLRDPITKEELTVIGLEERGTAQGKRIMAGLLMSATSWYPIINGIPRILTGKLRVTILQDHYTFFQYWEERLPMELQAEWKHAIADIKDMDAFVRHQKRTGERFAFEWKHIYRENPYEKQNFLHFLSPFVREQDLWDKRLLDVGCGSGRFTKQAALAGAQVVFGTDVGESVVAAYELTKDLPNACIVQADVYHMPFRHYADLTFSIGVLHHLPQPEEGFKQLSATVTPGGQLLIWVYNRRNNFRAVYIFETIRKLTRHIPSTILYPLCYIPATAVHVVNQFTHMFKDLGFAKVAMALPFSYYANFPFNMKLNDAFDVFATHKSNYYYIEEIERWFKRAELANVRAHEHPEAGITAVAKIAII